jgi:hypothetical protein
VKEGKSMNFIFILDDKKNVISADNEALFMNVMNRLKWEKWNTRFE